MKKIVVTGVLFLLMSTAYADNTYVGLSYSSLDVELDAGGITADSEPSGINLVLGNSVSENISFEGLFGFGIGDDEVENAGFDFELKHVIGFSAVGRLPISEAISLYGKLGIAQVKYDDSDGDSSDASGVMYGIGAAFDITEQFGLNLEYIQYPEGEYDDFDIDVEASALNAGLYFKF